MTYYTYSNTWNGHQAPPIKLTTINLRTYTREAIKDVNAIDINVEYKGQQAKLNLMIVDGRGPSLLGWNWLATLYPFNHKPLKLLFKARSATPTVVSARIQRWSPLQGSYDYTIEYKQGDCHANADCLSHLPLFTAPSNLPVPPETVHLMDALDPWHQPRSSMWTAKDPATDLVQRGGAPVFSPYDKYWKELSVC